MTLYHCLRCGCSLDVGDVAEDDSRLCQCCSLIVGGTDPYIAMLAASARKARIIASQESAP